MERACTFLGERVAVVTGAGSGIGRATSIKLAEMGMKLVLVGKNAAAGAETLRTIEERGGEATYVQADLAKAASVERYVNHALATYGRIDVFVNNAGVLQRPSLLADTPEEEFDRMVAVNLKAAFLGMKHVLKVMEQQGSGVILNTASTAGMKPEHSLGAYSATKHALVSLTKSAALEYAKKGIRVNAICPGGTLTPMVVEFGRHLQESGYVMEEMSKLRLGRLAEPEEIANVIAFLVSPEAGYMTGAVVAVDGGVTL